MSAPLLVLTPLAIEARAVASGLGVRPLSGAAAALDRAGGPAVVRAGMGPAAAARCVGTLVAKVSGPVVVAGVAGHLGQGAWPGDVVVADRVVDAGGRVVAGPLASAPLLAGALARAGLRVKVGPVASVEGVVRGGNARRALAERGALAVDMESACLAGAGWAGPVAVVRVVVDTPERELVSMATIGGGRAALATLRRMGPVLSTWASAAGARRVVLAGPRSFCAGVERAVTTVERALDRFGAPVYVRRQIVHNAHVVADLEGRGAVFVTELDQVPSGATVVLSAHGVAPRVRAEAGERGLRVIDATCPLVAKVHREVRRFSAAGYQVVLVGHRGHDEVEGTLGEDPGIALVETPADVAGLAPGDPSMVAYTTQTTLATDEAAEVVAALAGRFPGLVGPAAGDICYATQNRQDALRAIAGQVDLVLVVGSANSSNTTRLAEVARRAGTPAEVIEDSSALKLESLVGARCVGLTAGASAPDALVSGVLGALSGLGPVEVANHDVTTETVRFSLPPEVR
ncbi:MAG: 4-hydroxy-3-methylbut-2-enyl diphosphate reductase [Acidimicrobiales bacterium]